MKRRLDRALAFAMDGAMCAMMNVIQWRRPQFCTRREWDDYLAACGDLTREEFYRAPDPEGFRDHGEHWTWTSPVQSSFHENDRARVNVFAGGNPAGAPTVIILHALMSANDLGYRKVARWFNERGWNVVFPHLPYHYSRTPRGFLNGELAVTANLVRLGQTLQQGVIEMRQLMGWLRGRGVREFGLLGTSFGGWNGALLSFLERDFRFIALIQPIVNLEKAIWSGPAAMTMRGLLTKNDIRKGESLRHAHLSSPLHGVPLGGAGRTILTAGSYDLVSPPAELAELQAKWPGSRLLRVTQGHFGYAALRETLKEIGPLL